MREAIREADAAAAVLAIGPDLVEYAGDDAAVPAPLPIADRTVPLWTRCRCRSGQTHDTALIRLRAAVSQPPFTLCIVNPGHGETQPFDVVEHAVEALEAIVVPRCGRLR